MLLAGANSSSAWRAAAAVAARQQHMQALVSIVGKEFDHKVERWTSARQHRR